MIRVLYVSDSDTLSGAEVVLLHYIDHLPRDRFATHVLLRDRNARLGRALAERGAAFTAADTFSEDLIETTLSPRRLLHFARAFRRTTALMTKLNDEQNVDVIHSISYPASLYAAFAARRTGVKQVWHEHNIKRIHRVSARLYRFVAATAAAVVGPSDAVTNNLRRARLPAGRARTIYNGVDLAKFRIDDAKAAAVRRGLGLVEGQPAVGLFGQMLPYKGHRLLIDALARLRSTPPTVRGFFVGALENPPYQDELRREVEAAGLADRVQFTGWRGDVADVMRAMDVVVLATTTPEPASLTLMEAMAMGRPVVAARVGGTAELVVEGQTALLFEPADAAQLAERLAMVLGDAALRRRMGEAGRLRVEQYFALPRHLEAMQAVYAEAAAQRRPRAGA